LWVILTRLWLHIFSPCLFWFGWNWHSFVWFPQWGFFLCNHIDTLCNRLTCMALNRCALLRPLPLKQRNEKMAVAAPPGNLPLEVFIFDNVPSLPFFGSELLLWVLSGILLIPVLHLACCRMAHRILSLLFQLSLLGPFCRG